MFRKSVLSMMVTLMATSALAAGPGRGGARETGERDRKEREVVTGTRETGKTAGKTNDTAKTLDDAAKISREATTAREAAQLLEDIVNNPQRFGVPPEGVQKFYQEVVRLSADGKMSVDQAIDTALARRGTNKEDLKEKCKPL